MNVNEETKLDDTDFKQVMTSDPSQRIALTIELDNNEPNPGTVISRMIAEHRSARGGFQIEGVTHDDAQGETTVHLEQYSVAGIASLIHKHESGLIANDGSVSLFHTPSEPTPPFDSASASLQVTGALVANDITLTGPVDCIRLVEDGVETIVYQSPPLLAASDESTTLGDPRFVENCPRLVTKADVVGALAKWAVRQSPYPVPEGLEDALRSFIAQYELPENLAGMNFAYFADRRAVEASFKFLFDRIPAILAWNEPKKLTGGVHGVSIYDNPRDPDTDFIDLDALARNVAMEAWDAGSVIQPKDQPKIADSIRTLHSFADTMATIKNAALADLSVPG